MALLTLLVCLKDADNCVHSSDVFLTTVQADPTPAMMIWGALKAVINVSAAGIYRVDYCQLIVLNF